MNETEAFHLLKKFLGGDPQASRIARILVAWTAVQTPEELRTAREATYTSRTRYQGWVIKENAPELLEVPGIGPDSIARIDAALAGEL